MQSHDQIARPPAHYAMDGRDRALVHDPGEESLVLVPELGGPARRGDVDEALWPAFVEPDHPVPQRLTVHSANCRRLCPRRPVERYGPVCPVVWEGRRREVPPYPDQSLESHTSRGLVLPGVNRPPFILPPR